MVYTIKDDVTMKRARWLFEKMFVSDNILRLNPVIAGGAALSVFKTIRLHDTERKWKAFSNGISKDIQNKMMYPYGDIDLWFFSDNPIFTSKNNVLVSDYSSEHLEKINTALFNLPSIPRLMQESVLVENKVAHIIKEDYNFSLRRSTKWANTYHQIGKNGSLSSIKFHTPVQFIKKPISNGIEDLINSFDISLCSIAWHNDTFFINN